ncbi:MAG: amidohydrolase family protein [Acidobacteria bacterium]|nr:amidohydrolase family protein [Acidobacteriota bacterium]
MRGLLLLLGCAAIAAAQAPSTPSPSSSMDVREYEPKSSLVSPQHPKTRAKYPFIDVHNHPRFPMQAEQARKMLADMDGLNMRIMGSLFVRGGNNERLKSAIDSAQQLAPGRIFFFASPDYSGLDDPGYAQKAAAQLEKDVKLGARGLKVWKDLGLNIKDAKGERIHIDDARFDPLWAMCGRLKVPVFIHTADPKQFWEPIDKNNERWLELQEMPGRRRDPAKDPSWEQLITEQHNVFRKHKNTIFIDAHLGWLGGDLGRLGKLMDECPNVYTEIGAVLAELGRQPRYAREWFIKHQDRVVFGKDTWAPTEYYSYFQVLETADDYFPYYRRRHAFWAMYGLDLPDEVLKKLYYRNALRIIPGLDATGFPK